MKIVPPAAAGQPPGALRRAQPLGLPAVNGKPVLGDRHAVHMLCDLAWLQVLRQHCPVVVQEADRHPGVTGIESLAPCVPPRGRHQGSQPAIEQLPGRQPRLVGMLDVKGADAEGGEDRAEQRQVHGAKPGSRRDGSEQASAAAPVGDQREVSRGQAAECGPGGRAGQHLIDATGGCLRRRFRDGQGRFPLTGPAARRPRVPKRRRSVLHCQRGSSCGT